MATFQQSLILGFLVANGVGFLASFVLGRWSVIRKTWDMMFNKAPVPVLKKVSKSDGNRGVSTNPTDSPLKVINSGCVKIVFQGLALLGGSGAAIVLIAAMPLDELRGGFFEGIFYAGLLGIVLQLIRKNFHAIQNAFKKIVNGPNPSLDFEKKPNKFVVAAKPTVPPFNVLVNSIGEIIWRIAWSVVLIVFLFLTLSLGYNLLVEETFSVSPTTIFNL